MTVKNPGISAIAKLGKSIPTKVSRMKDGTDE
jgi:hypothetical protein